MSDLKAIRRGDYLFCPVCGGMVDYDPHQRRFKCLVRACGWMDEEETGPGDYDFLTGMFGKQQPDGFQEDKIPYVFGERVN